MIRQRRDEDLGRLCEILAEIEDSQRLLAGTEPHSWLTGLDAEQSWVFDQAPVHVAPTGNVVGHLQIHDPALDPAGRDLAGCVPAGGGEPLEIGRFFVRPGAHRDGFSRYLLKESVSYVRGRGRTPVLDLDRNGPLSQRLCERLGFVPSPEPGRTLLVHTV